MDPEDGSDGGDSDFEEFEELDFEDEDDCDISIIGIRKVTHKRTPRVDTRGVCDTEEAEDIIVRSVPLQPNTVRLTL